ncbi:2Fe-2S iron-sulfur cluster-binding protein [Bordetella avium]|uniref:Ferredoxin n=1 Tax=Bordetella avium (strain 197N) TaxID=360910 RepID=Q2KXS7_BORA1|nr:2Fe-2S iron-sulfur cluster-binding protein [Bordetella avium]AZY49804.1 ferredoxin [Bordetella avium]AZY53143.1 ferredoxin [Bordetella avium]RIQ12513.1 ferredoxin [Bordetella avium]RIQ17604.1 ferredoxin [Bordetella avium]RIQ32261.1 ferredoxin [Bordetella avium]
MSGFEVLLLPAGWRFRTTPDTPLLLAAKAAGIRMPSSCRNGTCRSCLCQMRSGEVSYRIEWPGVASDEQAEGWILPCVAYAESDLEVHAPQAQRIGPEAAEPERRLLTGARRA